MEILNAHNMREMLLEICDLLIAKEQELCRLDTYVGDGDHGITVSRGFGAVKAKLAGQDVASLKDLLLMTGEVLSDTMGGAIGPIIGSIFTSMGETAGEADVIGTELMAAMLRNGLKNVLIIGNAKPGDRTLVDALSPAVEALETAVVQHITLVPAMENAVQAAKTGAENTKNMIAKKGRARYLQEKSVGYQDAGATSMYLILAGIAAYCGKNRGSKCRL
jgi:dihydroxyacetone kinase phosphoprotein-dependent L subunit